MITIDKVLEDILSMDDSSREILFDILHKRLIEERRKKIAGNARKAKSDFSRGKLKSSSATEVIKKLKAS